MLKQMITALRLTLVLAVLTGLIFPLLVTAVAQFLFPYQANGSLIRNDKNEIIGSALIGQQFTESKYFHPRPSAAGSGYAAEASSGTNLGPTSRKLILGDQTFSGIKQLAEQYRQENNLPEDSKVPVDAVTRSGSGLDPHISEANAKLQVSRVAAARQMPAEKVSQLVHKYTEGRQLGILGEPRVNVLILNLALDKQAAVL